MCVQVALLAWPTWIGMVAEAGTLEKRCLWSEFSLCEDSCGWCVMNGLCGDVFGMYWCVDVLVC